MPHRCARFGPGGHLVQVLPNLPSAGQPALVDIHSMEVCFSTLVSFLESFPLLFAIVAVTSCDAIHCIVTVCT